MFDKTIAKQVNKYMEKVKATSPFEYNSLITPDKNELLRDRFTRTMLINSVWYSGVDVALKKLYSRDLNSFRDINSDELNYFWAQPTEGLNIRKIHSGIPQLISEKMVDLILSNGYEIKCYVDKDLTDEDLKTAERKDDIAKWNNLEEKIGEAIETESWGGGVAFKLSAAKRFPYPVIEAIQPDEYEPRIEAGRIVEDIFITYYESKGTFYKLKEYYGFDEAGSYIKYKLYKKNETDWIETNLSEIEETRGLTEWHYPNVKRKFSLYKPNKLPNSEFRGSKLGESDYSGSHGVFDAIDEVLSTMVQEFRDGRIKNFWPSDLLPVDPTSNKQYVPPSLKKDFIVYNTGIGEKEKPNKPEMVQGEIHSEKYIETFKKLIETVLNNAGLSPQTIGVTGLESTAASEESQQLREKVSIRTREKKVGLWVSALNELMELALMLDDIKNGNAVGDYTIVTTFNDYKIKSLVEKTNEAVTGVQGKTWDILTAVKHIHESMTEEEQILTAVKIKVENGIFAFTKEEEAVYKKFVNDLRQPNV